MTKRLRWIGLAAGVLVIGGAIAQQARSSWIEQAEREQQRSRAEELRLREEAERLEERYRSLFEKRVVPAQFYFDHAGFRNDAEPGLLRNRTPPRELLNSRPRWEAQERSPAR